MSPRGASSGGSSDENLSSDSGNDDPACCAGPSKPSVVPKGNPFWHTTCCCRFFFFFFGYFALMLGCLRLVKMGRQDVGLALLTIGPTIVIICCFFSRYRFSVTARQITVTFLEAICWMVPLLFLIGYIDMFNDRFLSKEVEVLLGSGLIGCRWERSEWSKIVSRFVGACLMPAELLALLW